MKLNVKSLTTGLQFHGEVQGKRQHYYVLSSARHYFVMSVSRSKRDAGNFNLVGKSAVETLYRRLRRREVLVERARHRGRAAALVERHHLQDAPVPLRQRDLHDVAGPHVLGGLHRLIVDVDLAAVAGGRRQAARLEGARRPQPLVHAHGFHGPAPA